MCNQVSYYWFACTFFLIFSTTTSVTVFNNLGSQRTKYGTILSFEITSKSEMYCFFEDFTKGAKLRIKVTALNSQSSELHMRLTSPSLEFSEWFHSRDQLMYHENTDEEGDYEICVTARVNYGKLKIALEIFAHNEDELKQRVADKMELDATKKAIFHSFAKVWGQIHKVYYGLKNSNLAVRKDQLLQENNAKFIDYFSGLQIIVIILGSFVQTYFIRKLFAVNTRIKI